MEFSAIEELKKNIDGCEDNIRMIREWGLIDNHAIKDIEYNKGAIDGMKTLGLKETEKFKVFGIGGGGFIRKTDSVAFGEMNQKLNKEFNDKIKNDDNFVYEAFLYELGNHEYCITWDLEPTLDSLGLTMEQVENDERLSTILKKARTEYNSHSDEY